MSHVKYEMDFIPGEDGSIDIEDAADQLHPILDSMYGDEWFGDGPEDVLDMVKFWVKSKENS